MPYVQSNGATIFWREDGDPAQPALLLLNSLGTDLSMWDDVTAALRSGWRNLRTDFRGHGKSETSRGDYTMDMLADDALAVMDAAGVEKASICGLSLGALVAAQLANQHPDRVRAVILCNVAVAFNPPDWEQRAETVRRSGMDPLVEPVLSRFLSSSFRAARSARVEAVRAMLASTDPQGYAACCMAIARTPILPTELGGTGLPLLAIGGAQDAAAPPAHAEAIAGSVPGGEVRILDTGHLSATEDPAGFSDAVRSFLERVQVRQPQDQVSR